MPSGNAFWPGSIATDANLFVAVNGLATALSAAVNATVTTIPVVSTTNFPTTGGIVIDSEVIFYTGISGSTLTGCTRGADGTTATTHLLSAVVGLDVIAYHHNQLNDEIEAIETFLSGGNAGQVLSSSGGTTPAVWLNPTGGSGGGSGFGITQLTGGVTATAILATAGTSVSAASPATSVSGGTLTLNLDGDGAKTITLGTDVTGAAVAADIQAKVAALIANTPSNQAAYTDFTAVYGSSVYTLTSGILGSSSTVVVSGGTDQAALKLGLAYSGTETTGQAAVTVVPATVITNANLTGGVTSVGNATTVVTNANLTGNVTSVGNATTIVALPAISGAALTNITAANISSGTAGISISGNAATATDLSGGAAGELPWQSAANTTLFTAAGTSNQILQSNGTSAPSWTSAPTIAATNLTGTTTVNTTGNASTATLATTATNIAGGAVNEIPYQSAANTTTFVSAPGANMILGANSGNPMWTNTPTFTGTNISGTAASLTAGTVTTNANLTGNVSSIGNVTTLVSIPAISGANLTGTAPNLTAGVATTADALNSATTTVVVNGSPAPVAGYVLTATSSTAAEWLLPVATATYQRTFASGNSSTTVFTVPNYVVGNSSLLVFNDGVLMTITADYTESSGTTVTFNTAPVTGATLSFIVASSEANPTNLSGGATGEILYQSAANTTTFTAAAAGGELLSASGTTPTWTAAGTTGQILQSNGSSIPTWGLYTDVIDAVGNSGTSQTVNWASGLVVTMTLTGNCTFTWSNAIAGQTLTLFLKQDATGSRTVTWPTTKWPSATAPTLTLTAAKTDIIGVYYDGSAYWGFVGGLNY